MLIVKQLFFSRDREILSGIDLKLRKGEIMAIVGPSGAGKSTLLKLLAGMLDADRGEIIFNGSPVKGPSDRLIPGHPEIKLVDQHFDLDPFHTTRENLRLCMEHLPRESQLEFIDELLQLMQLEEHADQKASELSGGEQQRLALARAIASEPEVLLLDEPFSHIDAHLRRAIADYLILLKKRRKTSFVLVSHDGQEVLNMADYVAFFDQGKIERLDLPESIYREHRNAFEAAFFGPINRIHVQRKEVLFRPDEYQTDRFKGALELEISYLQSHFFGLYQLDEYRYKKNRILLFHHGKTDLNRIFVRNNA
ncbi:MAG: ABC transporter ATP-binding protein [Bacteroidetes bacterium]|nr:MAG: ABC transporter ATP-binding protein [Bacteroidota bacterium]